MSLREPPSRLVSPGDSDAFELAYPPPYAIKERNLSNNSETNLPGKIQIDESGELILKYMSFRGIVADQIANYDHFILIEIGRILQSRRIRAGDRIFKFVNPRIQLPVESPDIKNSPILLPRLARETKKTYSFTLFAKIEESRVDSPDQIISKSQVIKLGMIPVILGSISDHLRAKNMTKNQLLQVGECMQDPFGYFIIRGSERVIMIQEKLRGNRILIFNDSDGNPTCQITSISIRGSTVIRLYQDNNRAVRLFFSLLSLKKEKNKGVNTISALQILRLLIDEYNSRIDDPIRPLNPDLLEIVKYILRFVRPEWKKKVLFALVPSIDDSIRGDDYRDIYNNSTIKSKWDRKREYNSEATGTKTRALGPDPGSREQWAKTKAEILIGILNRLFPHISYPERITVENVMNKEDSKKLAGPLLSKIMLLSLMIAKFAETISGLRSIDDRDNWANKRLESGGGMMGQLFKQLWYQVIDQVEVKMEKVRTELTAERLASLVQETSSPIVTNNIENSFIPNSWGPPKTKTNFYQKQENITDHLDRGQSILAVQRNLTKINTPTSREDMNASVRSIQGSQVGYIDMVDTPSGKTVGLVKYKALTCWISVPRPEGKIRKLLENRFQTNPTPYRSNILLLNGIPYGWCDANDLRHRIVSARRRLEVGFDITVVIDEDILYIYTDGSRPTRPLLILDDDGIPVITKKELWKSDFHTLLKEGAVEYIDPWENFKHNVISPTLDKLDHYREDLRMNEHILDKHLEELRHLEEKLEKNPRPARLTDDLLEVVMKDLINKLPSTDQPIFQEGYSDPEIAWINTTYALRQLKGQIGRVKLNIQRLERRKYTHAEMHPSAILGVASSLIPFIGTNPGPRNNFQCSMSEQALGINNSNPAWSYPTTDKYLATPSTPLAGTMFQKLFGLDDLPAGANVVLAIATTSSNEEDAITIKKEALERGLFTWIVLHSYNEIIQFVPPIVNRADRTKTIKKRFLVKPVKPFPGHTIEQYDNIDENGIAMIDRTVLPGDCLICIVLVTRVITYAGQEISTNYEDRSVYLKPFEEGVIDSILVAKTPKGELSVTVRVRAFGTPVVGDKLATRAAQKSVIGRIVPERFLPVTKNGVVPDIIINPHSIPKRMTMSTLIEIVTSKYAAMAGERINATAFEDYELDSFMELLETVYGFERSGAEIMRNPISGELYPAVITIGPTYYQLLKHQVRAKTQVRGTGASSLITGGAVRGRVKGGGVRAGEMERDSLIGHGSSHFLQERFTSEPLVALICINCKMLHETGIDEGVSACPKCDGKLVKYEMQRTLNSLRHYAAAAGVQIAPRLGSRLNNLVDGTEIDFIEEIDENEEDINQQYLEDYGDL